MKTTVSWHTATTALLAAFVSFHSVSSSSATSETLRLNSNNAVNKLQNDQQKLQVQLRRNERRLMYSWKSLLYATRVCQDENDTWLFGWTCPPDPICDGPHPPHHCYSHYRYVDDQYQPEDESGGNSGSGSGSSWWRVWNNDNSDSNSDSNSNGDSSSGWSDYAVNENSDNYGGDESANGNYDDGDNDRVGDDEGEYVQQTYDSQISEGLNANSEMGDDKNASSTKTKVTTKVWPYFLVAAAVGVAVASVLFKKREVESAADLEDHELHGSVSRRMGLLADGDEVPPIDNVVASSPMFLPVEPAEQSAANPEVVEYIEMELQRNIEAGEGMDDIPETPYVSV